MVNQIVPILVSANPSSPTTNKKPIGYSRTFLVKMSKRKTSALEQNSSFYQ
jgi:hypothetical protein